MKVLIVDDDPLMCRMLALALRQLGHAPVAAGDGRAALAKLDADTAIDLVISDWMMPEMNGLELCREIRARQRANYVHILLLTARQEREDYLEAMDAGADDFLGKPLDPNLLAARLRVAARLLGLQADLRHNNTLLAAAHQELSQAYDNLYSDLAAAARVQESLLPERQLRIHDLRFASALFASASISGDIFNYFPLADGSVAIYAVDVAGHGARAALMSVTLSRLLTAETFVDDGQQPRAPDAVIADLNQRFQQPETNPDYFTMFGAVVTPTGRLRFCQAGHPNPMVIPADPAAPVRALGGGGFPVALLDFADFSSHDLALAPGDRVFVYSDGVTECAAETGELFGEPRLIAKLGELRGAPMDELIASLHHTLIGWQGGPSFKDDVSLLAFERTH